MSAKIETTQAQIDAFFAKKRLAVVGVSRTANDFTRLLFNELRNRGWDVVPVNPAAEQIDDLRCYARVQDITPPVEAALIMTTPNVTEQIVRDCAEAGVNIVWMHRGEGIGAVSEKAIEFCEANGINVVAGHCPFMFLENTGFIHRAHGFFKKLTGSYPN